ncbi:MAG: hypothetical protein AAGC78_10095 [Cellvibrio sp.]|uniref:hypothetical protein n=1 Tax=Cellvibrio sp. TaxID=1965322 RepID=UPI0031A9A972
MKYLKYLMSLFAFVSLHAGAFEFNNSNTPYDFSQTTQIFIVDQKNEKFFGMFDPFEMKMTTVPSRFYVSVMGAIERGHRNVEGVFPIEGAVNDHEYVLIFRSLNRSHILLIGKDWVVDGNKKIQLSPEEVVAIYELLLERSNDTQATDLQKLNGLFEEINNQQVAADGDAKISNDDELKSIIESKKTIEERLPAGYDDSKSLPYHNKALENERFLEEQEKAKKLTQEPLQFKNEPSEPVEKVNEAIEDNALPLESVPENKQPVIEQQKTAETGLIMNGLIAGFVIVLLCLAGFLRVRGKNHQ